jgi:hypothetical protein
MASEVLCDGRHLIRFGQRLVLPREVQPGWPGVVAAAKLCARLQQQSIAGFTHEHTIAELLLRASLPAHVKRCSSGSTVVYGVLLSVVCTPSLALMTSSAKPA